MPAMLDDPDSPTIYRTSGAAPYPDPHDANPILPVDVVPRQVTLRDRVTVATIVPFSSRHQVPPTLLAYLSDQLNKEIENGDTYPMIDGMPADKFSSYWFQNFGAVMLLGNITSASEVVEGKDWTTECLGSFYIKPNYPGRSSHVCNAGFLVTAAARNRGVGRLMGEAYLDYAPKLGYTYSVFNLVYETNVASCRIWDALGFKRIGKVKGCGNLKSYPGQLIDAIIYGRDLGKEGVAEEEYVSEERFDKIKFYLKTGKYPAGADRAEKSRLRSAATHYKLVPATPPPLDSTTNRYSSGDGIGIGMGLSAGASMMGEEVVEEKLMLKDKEVISDPRKQYSIARNIHERGGHGGINKTTATIAERFHWVRIKETVSLVIKNCAECKESTTGKPPTTITSPLSSNSNNNLTSSSSSTTANTIGRMGSVGSSVSGSMSFHHQSAYQEDPRYQDQRHQYHEDQRHHPHEEDSYPHQGQQSVSPQVLNRTLPHSHSPHPSHHHPHLQNRHPDPSHLHNSQPNPYSQHHPSSPTAHQSHHQSPHSHSHSHSRSSSLSTLNHHNQQLRDQYMPPMPLPLDPQIMVGVGVDVHHLTSLSASLTAFGSHHHSSTHHEHTHLSEHLSEQESHSPLPEYGADVHEDQDQDQDGDLDMLRMSDQEDEDEDNGEAGQVVEMFGSGPGEGKKADSG